MEAEESAAVPAAVLAAEAVLAEAEVPAGAVPGAREQPHQLVLVTLAAVGDNK